MDESKWETPLYVTLEEPITVGVLCRCLTNLLLGALLGFALILFSAAPGGSPSGGPAQTPPASILLGLVVPVVIGFLSHGNAAALFSAGTGTLLLVLPLSMAAPLKSMLPWMGGATFIAAGAALLLRHSSPSDDAPRPMGHLKSVAAGIFAGLLACLFLSFRVTPKAALEAGLIPCLAVVAMTLLSFGMVSNGTFLGPIALVIACTAMAVYTNIGKDSFLTAMVFGVIALSAAIPSMTEESREPRILKIPALPD